MKKYFWFLILIISGFLHCQAQNDKDEFKHGYKIRILQKKNTSEDKIILNRVLGKSFLPIDSIQNHPNQTPVFKGQDKLKPGMYSIFISKNTKLDFLISSNQPQRFDICIDYDHLYVNISFIGSVENSAFVEYLNFLKIEKMEVDHQYSLSGLSDLNQDSLSIRIDNLINQVGRYSQNLENKFSGSTLAFLIQSNHSPTLTDISSETNHQQTLEEFYLKEHFFDSVNFDDERTITTPILAQRMRFYFQNLKSNQTDMLFKAIDDFASKLKPNSNNYRIAIEYLYNFYYNSPLHDRSIIYNYIADKYLINYYESWNDKTFISKVKERLIKSRLNQIGEIAPNLKLKSPKGSQIELQEIQATMTVILFYDPECEACHSITRKTLEIYHEFKSKGIKVFAVYIAKDRNSWINYIERNRLDWINVSDPDSKELIEKKYDINVVPLIYLLDKNKKIIAKDIEINKLNLYLDSLK